MKDFEEIAREEVLAELVKGSDIYAFVLNVDSRKAVTYGGYKLRDEKIGGVQRLINKANVVFYKKKEEVEV